MQPKSNSFWGNDILDSFNNASSDVDSIWDQYTYYKANMLEFLLWWFKIFITLYEKAI